MRERWYRVVVVLVGDKESKERDEAEAEGEQDLLASAVLSAHRLRLAGNSRARAGYPEESLRHG